MKKIVFILLVTVMACSSPVHKKAAALKTTLQSGIVHDSLKCKNDPSVGYAVYLPKEYKDSGKAFPVMFFFDARKRGVLPVKRYRELAERYGFIFVGSNSSTNGLPMEETTKIINVTVKDALNRFNIDPGRVFTSGFSGGARVAVLTALSGGFGVRGVIGCAAGFPDVQSPVNINFNWVGVVGNRDFNYLELVDTWRQLKETGHNSSLVVFDGIHEWPPVEAFDDAIDALLGGHPFPGFTESAESKRLENEEFKQRRVLANAIAAKNINWWNAKISKLEEGAEKAKTEGERLVNARLLSFMSMVSFMYAQNAVLNYQTRKAEKYLTIYEKVDPENPDVYFLKAEYFIQLMKTEETMQMLTKAAGLGYANYENLMNSNLLKQLHGNPGFKDISEKVFENMQKE